MNWKRTLLRVLLFACFGLLIELCFTGLGSSISKGNWNLRGHSSPWMMPVYGLLGILVGPISEALKGRNAPFLLRAVAYMLMIFFVEYVAGVLFEWVGLDIWDYSKRPLNLHGHITLTYAPFWFFLGLWLEYLHRKLDACAVALVHGFTADELLQSRQKSQPPLREP